MNDAFLRSFCNACGRETDHDVLWKRTSTTEAELADGSSYPTELHEFQLVSCRGCSDFALRIEQWDEVEVRLAGITFQPPRLWRKSPGWLDGLEALDPDLHGLLIEVYSAANHQQTRLLSMGVRAALDHAMMRILGGDKGSFTQKLDEMVKRGHLTSKQRDNIDVVIDAGSASAHRGFKPPKQLLDEMMAEMEGVIRSHYITGPMLNTAKALIPPRP